MKRMTDVVCTALDRPTYGEDRITDTLYRLSVGIWIMVGLSSCAGFITTIGDTYRAIVWRVEDKAMELKDEITGEKTGSANPRPSSSSGSGSRYKRRVAPAESYGGRPASDTGKDVDGCHDDRIWIT